MEVLILPATLLFIFSILGILLLFCLNPFLIWMVSCVRKKRVIKTDSLPPSVSLIIVARNAENLVADKLKNSLSLNYPPDQYEIIFFSDGSTDGTEKKVQPWVGEKVRFLNSPTHEGKHNGMNKSAEVSSGEILVFSDADAILEKDAIAHLIKYFSDPTIGGVCGRRLIGERGKRLNEAQSAYIHFDSAIKQLESQIGSISSNDGKLYAIRHSLYQPIPSGVMDDLHAFLSVVKQGYRFIFEPDAKAFIKVPSRSSKHEFLRRRRIVSMSLRGIWIMKELLNPFKYGLFSISFFINKVIRRFLPVCLIFLFFTSFFLSFYHSFVTLFFITQVIFYSVAFFYWILLQHLPKIKMITKIGSLIFYFCIGNYGTLMGLLDFILGRKITKWEPIKGG